MSTLASNRWIALVLASTAALSACRRGEQGQAAPPAPAPAPAKATAVVPAAAVEERVDDETYVKAIRPMLTRHGCDASSCHGTFKGGGLAFSTGNPRFFHDYQSVLDRIDRKNPRESVLLKKALGLVEHNGGKNLSELECDARRLVAWIGKEPDIECPDPPAPQSPERFAREVAPALKHLGCAAAACHGAPGTAAGHKLDLTGVAGDQDAVKGAYGAFERSGLNHVVVWMSPVIKAAWGEDKIHKAVDRESCAYRRLHGYIAGAPEAECDVTRPSPVRLSVSDFSKVVMPSLAKRGCIDCHGNAAGDMSLFKDSSDPHVGIHDFLALTARIEDPRRPEDSTLLRTLRNKEPHGGGKRLGGKGDCLDEMVLKWIQGQPVKACPPPKKPSFELFASRIQGVLDKMTCTQAYCHGESIPSFQMTPHAADRPTLIANYQSVIRWIDYDYMPFSEIQLRMREPCAYSVVGAWIEGKSLPTCEVHDPDPSIFPKRDRTGRILHPKMAPGAPPPTTKS